MGDFSSPQSHQQLSKERELNENVISLLVLRYLIKIRHVPENGEKG